MHQGMPRRSHSRITAAAASAVALPETIRPLSASERRSAGKPLGKSLLRTTAVRSRAALYVHVVHGVAIIAALNWPARKRLRRFRNVDLDVTS